MALGCQVVDRWVHKARSNMDTSHGAKKFLTSGLQALSLKTRAGESESTAILSETHVRSLTHGFKPLENGWFSKSFI